MLRWAIKCGMDITNKAYIYIRSLEIMSDTSMFYHILNSLFKLRNKILREDIKDSMINVSTSIMNVTLLSSFYQKLKSLLP